jgi:hypothetical protein
MAKEIIARNDTREEAQDDDHLPLIGQRTQGWFRRRQ